MKISINNEVVLELSELQKKVIMNEVPEEIFDTDIRRRLDWCISHPANRFLERNSENARKFLKEKGVASVPSDKLEFASLVFEHDPVQMSDKECEKHIVKVDGEEFFEITNTIKQLLKMDVAKNCCCIEWAKERLKWILIHKFENCMHNLRNEWESKLALSGIKQLPIDDEEFANLVFSQPEYKNRS